MTSETSRFVRKLCAIALVALFGAVIAGCGGDDAGPDPEAEQREMAALASARTAAMTAAAAAKTASDDAAAAVAGVSASKNADASSYTLAQLEAQKAKTASDAAQAANTAAASAATSAEAQAQQAIAEAEQAKAETAQADAMMYAGAVQAAQDAMDETARLAAEAEARALSAAQMATSTAASAAMTAQAAAQMAFDGITADMAATDPASYAQLTTALAMANSASQAAVAASQAAMQASTSEQAKVQQDIAEAAQADAEAAQADAVMYAGTVRTAYDVYVQNQQQQQQAEQQALAEARSAASTAASAAAAAATAADAALAGLAEKADQDQVSYAQAVSAASAAHAASQAAAAASQAAMLASTSEQAKLHQGIAEAEQAKAAQAQTDAEAYAGMVNMAYEMHLADEAAEAEAAALMAAQNAANAASEAAAAALAASTEALGGLTTTKAAHDPASYTNTVLAQGRAQAAAQAAATAAMNAMNAGNSTDAQMYQGQAEVEQGKAEQAQADAEMYAGMVQTAYDAYVAEQKRMNAAEQERIATARTKAGEASTMAATAAQAAAMSFETISDKSAHDPVSHASARLANAAAQAAASDAAAALAAATSATSAEVAEAAQATAEAALMRAEAARENAEMYAGMVRTAYDTHVAEEQRKMDVAAAKTAANTAATAARMMADNAKTEAKAGADLNDPVTIRLLAEAEAAAVAAEAAAEAASATDDLDEAMKQRDIAQEKQGEAENARSAAVMASDEAVRHAGINDPTEAIAIVAARAAASAAALRARAAADLALSAADAAPLSQAAADAAMAAGTAAAAAATASQSAQDADNLADAEMHRDEAQKQERMAQTKLGEATKASNNAIADARFLDNAKSVALATTVKAAKDAATAAKEAADEAKIDAEDALERARAARTDSSTVSGEIVKLNQAVTDAAQAVAAAAAAEMAVNAATSPEEVAEAEGAADKAADDARAAQQAANDALAAAMEAADTHVLDLFMAANPPDDPTTPPEGTKDDPKTEKTDESVVNENANRVAAVTARLAAAAGFDYSTLDFVMGNQSSTDTAAIRLEVTHDRMAAEDDPDTLEVDESDAKRAYTLKSGSVVAINPSDFTADTPTVKTMDLEDLGSFTGIELSKDNVYIHVYTDIEPQKIEMTPTATLQLGEVMSITVADTGSLGTPVVDDGTTSIPGSLKIAYDHDNDSTTANKSLPVSGTFTCSDKCTYRINEVDDKFSTISNSFTFIPDPVMIGGTPFIADSGKDMDYMAFGVWLKTADMTGVKNTDIEAGAFTRSPVRYLIEAALTGTATYEGPAVGVKSMGGAVSHVDGTATLMADFGKPGEDGADDTMMGSVSGSVDIGGMMVRLGESREIERSNASAIFVGKASSGDAMAQKDGTVSYPYTGVWGGHFVGASVDDATPANPIMPSSAVGTFGVSGGEGDAAMSLIGAFGAHKQ